MSVSYDRSNNMTLLFLTSVSFFGLILAALFTVNPPISQVDFFWRKPLVGSVFASVCVLGSLAALFPNECSKGINFGKGEEPQGTFYFSFKRGLGKPKSGSSVLRGHHPTCTCYLSHVFDLGSRTFCATCSGLLLGALIALLGVALYFFGNWQIGQNFFRAVWVGVLGVTLGLLQPLALKVQRSSVRVFSGAFFAIGALLILVVVDELARNLLLDIFIVFLTVFWLVTRISLSHWEHEKICLACASASCELGSWTKK